jgi:hypothetical protein
LAVEILKKIVCEGVIPFRYVAADSIYGNSPKFLEAVERVPGVTYLVALPRDTLCWLQDPTILEKSYRYAGGKRTKRILVETEKKPVTFEKIVRGTNDYFWYRRTVSEGTKGPVTYEFMKRRVVLCKRRTARPDGLADRSQDSWRSRHLFLLHLERRQIHSLENLRLALGGAQGHRAVL